MIDKHVDLFIGADHAPVVVNVAQYDSQWQYFFRIYYDGREWDIPEGCTATLVGKKKDGHVALYACEIEDNEIVVNPGFQLTACPGDVRAEVRITAQNGQSVATPRLVFAVAPSPESDEDVASGTTLTAYEEIFAEAEELMEAANNIAGLTVSATTGAAGSQAQATVSGGSGGVPYNIAFKIPKGDKGNKGDKGDPGERGLDGTGAVSTVMGESPDANHDVTKWSLMNLIYPVGSIYMSTEDTNPATLFGGGTWVAIENSFLLGASATYEAGSEGGNDSVALTAANNGPHQHNVIVSPPDATYPLAGMYGAKGMIWSTNVSPTSGYSRTGTLVNDSSNNGVLVAEESGDGEAFSIMPPYLAVYIWKRTA